MVTKSLRKGKSVEIGYEQKVSEDGYRRAFHHIVTERTLFR